MRLQKAHEAICRGGEGQSVTQTALACGFTHLGRFSQLYRATYGELPSKTLHRSR
ncbi:MAG: helix-turn-helix domain-containing protein [Salaquimonas sp.]|nr:helix-turn-helix domain-containing protein [Salaquimonas sp.]